MNNVYLASYTRSDKKSPGGQKRDFKRGEKVALWGPSKLHMLEKGSQSIHAPAGITGSLIGIGWSTFFFNFFSGPRREAT